MKITFLMLFTCDSGVCNMPKDSVPIHQPTSLFSIFSLKQCTSVSKSPISCHHKHVTQSYQLVGRSQAYLFIS